MEAFVFSFSKDNFALYRPTELFPFWPCADCLADWPVLLCVDSMCLCVSQAHPVHKYPQYIGVVPNGALFFIAADLVSHLFQEEHHTGHVCV